MGKDQDFLEAARNGNIGFIEKVLNQRAKRAGPLASLRRGPGVNLQDSGGYSALHHACLNGHSDIVRLLLAHEASPNLPDSRGSSPLHLAAWAGQQEIAKMLLTHPYRPANPNLQTIENETPLHCASQHGHTGALAVLLAHDADPNMRNTRGETPLDLAAQYGRLQAVQMLIRAHSELIAPYSNAAIEGTHNPQQSQHKSRHSSPLPHSGSVSTPSPSSPSLLSSPITPTRSIFPHTCLHLASRNGHKNVVEVLLAAGVSVNLLTPSGSALHEAALCGKESVVRTLLKAGIDLQATDAENRTALDILKEFPPHVTKHIIAVINNFRNQMDTDDGEEVVYRQHHQQQQPPLLPQRNSHGYHKQQQQQQYNNHYHFNSNNHLLNHSHSMQQSAYSKQRYASAFNGGGGGKSLDSGLQPEDGNGGRYYHDNNSPVHSQSNNSQNEMGVSPSSSMSSFEPASVSPRSRSSTGGIIGMAAQPVFMSSFAPAAPPKKPPRRNLSVSPTHTGQPFSYTSPNHQQQGQLSARQQQHRSSSNDSPYSHQSHGSVGGMSFDETQLRDRQRGDRLYASARESTRTAAGITTSSSTDMLEQRNEEGASSMKRPVPPPRNMANVCKDIIKCENPTLKSYNPNRKLKRNRNSYSLNMGDKERCSISSDSNSDPKQQTPMSPTNYQQPPTPEHPPPTSTQAERTIYERIRPLSQEYKRRSALLQQQQLMIDTSTSPPQQMAIVPAAASYDCAFEQCPAVPLYYGAATLQGSSGSLSSSVSCSDHSISTDCVEEYVGDVPFAGLLKGSSVNLQNDSHSAQQHQRSNNNTNNNNNQCYSQRSSSASVAAAADEQLRQRTRPPIPTKPMLPERKLLKPTTQPAQTHTNNDTNAQRNSSDLDTDSNSNTKENINENCLAAIAPKDNGSNRSLHSYAEERNESSTEDTTTAPNNSQEEGSILSPFNAEDARKKISEIIESFGSGILNSNITPTNDIELDFDELDVSAERYELAIRLRNCGLLHLERMLFENGYDNYKFVHGVFEEADLQLMAIPDKDATKLLRFVETLPKAEFQPQIPNKTQQENKLSHTDVPESKGVATLSHWLSSINLPEYNESFNKHLYNTIDSVCGVWDVELQTVLEINKLGHRRRILQSLAYIRQMREPKSVKTPLGENNETNKMNTNGVREPQAQPQTQPRTSITGYRKNRPAPQPPTNKQQHPPLQIRAPSELLLGLPANLRTKWRHSANVLLNEQIKYEVYYLGSTVVKELRGTESTRKSIKKFKRDQRTATDLVSSELQHQQHLQQQQQQHKLSRNSSFNRQRKLLVCLAISHRGVEFIDVETRHTICEHEIQNINCACQDPDDLKHFAYITKDNDIHYCHVFSVEGTDLATEIILTLGQAFEVAYQLALRDGICTTPSALTNSILQGDCSSTVEPK